MGPSRRFPPSRPGRLLAALLLVAALATACRPFPGEAPPRMTPGDRLPSPTMEIPPPID